MKLNYYAEELPEFNSYAITSFRPSREVFNKRNRLIRYHYTSATVVKSILEGNPKLRFTDIRYMNDYSEMLCCVKRMIEYIKHNREKYPYFSNVFQRLLLQKHTEWDYLNSKVSQIEFEENGVYPYDPVRCFAFCMSTKPDSLPMWNYYVHNERYEGYNIGFDVYNFIKSFDTEDKSKGDPIIFTFGEVIYTEKEQFREIERIADVIEGDRKRIGDTGIAFNMARLRHYLETYGPFYKHEAFKEENEYRILLSITENRVHESKKHYFNGNLQELNIDFRDRKGVLVPYLEVPIDKKAVKSVMISPTIEKTIAEQSLREFLEMNDYKASISVSTIPIRF